MNRMEVLNGTRIGTIIQTLLYLTGVPVYKQSYDGNLPQDEFNSTRCYGELGCFQVKHAEARGFHLFPEKIQSIKPNICLFTHEFNPKCQLISEDIKELRFSNGTKSYWIAHGYFENGERQWIKDLTAELLSYDKNSNVFVVDWYLGAQPPYTQATVNIELLAAYTARIMILIQNTSKFNISDAHFIGHSLGAHFGGFVGSHLKEMGYHLGRISGLDPAQPYFENFPEDIRLDPSDALFVDVIHTDAKPLLQGGSISGLGTRETCGHADYYPNNGKNQPGCNDGVYQAILQENSLLFGMRRFLGCDHIRAYEYFTESIRSSCDFASYNCPTWESLVNATCELSCDREDSMNLKCNRMGFHAKKPTENTIYYSITGSRKNYCRDHFVFKINAENEEPGITNQELNIYSGNKYFLTVNLMQRRILEETLPGLTSNLQNQIVLRPNWSSPLSWFRRSATLLEVKSVSILHLETSQSYFYCYEDEGFNSITLSTESCSNFNQTMQTQPANHA